MVDRDKSFQRASRDENPLNPGGHTPGLALRWLQSIVIFLTKRATIHNEESQQQITADIS